MPEVTGIYEEVLSRTLVFNLDRQHGMIRVMVSHIGHGNKQTKKHVNRLKKRVSSVPQTNTGSAAAQQLAVSRNSV